MDAYVARQPILDRKKKLYAYELLFRHGLSNFMPEIEGDIATSKLLSSSFFTIGMDRITGGKRAFINFTQNLLEKQLPMLFPKETTVVEILEDVRPAESVIQSCRQMAKNGYVLALDDFVFHPSMGALIDLANIIKIDFRLTPMDQIKECVTMLPTKHIRLLAEKVETNEEFKMACDMGFDLFQGYFFCKPEIIKGKEIASSQWRMVQIISEVNKPDFAFEKIEQMVTQDVSLSYKLLRYINSAYFQRPRNIDTIKQALIYLGQDEIRRFISLIALSKTAAGKPSELIKDSCIKAKFCELLGAASSCRENPGDLFTLGLFSNIDAILDQPMDIIMSNLPLSKKIKKALVENAGELAPFIALARRYQKGHWSHVRKLATETCIVEEQIPAIYLESCEWSNGLDVL